MHVSFYWYFYTLIFIFQPKDSSLDALNIAGTVQLDVNSTVYKQRLNKKGMQISTAEAGMCL